MFINERSQYLDYKRSNTGRVRVQELNTDFSRMRLEFDSGLCHVGFAIDRGINFSPSTSVSLASSDFTNCSTFINNSVIDAI